MITELARHICKLSVAVFVFKLHSLLRDKMTKGASPTQCSGGTVADQSSKMAATLIGFIPNYNKVYSVGWF